MQLLPHEEGYLLPVKVVPGASRERIAGTYGEGIKVTVRAAPEAGAANAAVLKLLAGCLQVPTVSLRILRGQTSPHKQVLISGLAADVIEQRLTD